MSTQSPAKRPVKRVPKTASAQPEAVVASKDGLPDDYPAALRALVPPHSVADNYVHRLIHGVPDFDAYAAGVATRRNVLLEGDTQGGKTTSLQAFAAEMGWAFVSIPCNGSLDGSTMYGQQEVISDPNTGASITVWVNGLIALALQHGHAVLYFDELNALDTRVLPVIHSITDYRRSITIPGSAAQVVKDGRAEYDEFGRPVLAPVTIAATPDASSTLLICGAYNEGYVGTSSLSEAVKERFQIQIRWSYDPDVEASLINSESLAELAGQLRAAYRDGSVITPTSTAKLITFETFLGVHEGCLDPECPVCGGDGLPGVSWDFAVGNFLDSYDRSERDKVRSYLDAMTPRLRSEYGIKEVKS